MQLRAPRLRWLAVPTVVLVVVAVGLRIGIPAYRQLQALREIEKCGAMVQSDATGPQWLRKWVGEDRMRAFDEIGYVEFPPEKRLYDRWAKRQDVEDSTLVCLRQLPDLTHLSLRKTAITDAGLAHVASLRNLEFLNITGTDITDDGLLLLKGHPKLRLVEVGIARTHVTEAAVAELERSLAPHGRVKW